MPSSHLISAMQETSVQSLSQEDPLENGMATHSNILAWRIQCTEGPSRLQSMGSQRAQLTLILPVTVRRVALARRKAGGKGDDRDEMAGWHHRLDGHEFR